MEQLIQASSVAVLGLIGVQLWDIYCKNHPKHEDFTTKHQRWTSTSQSSAFINGAKQPITNVEQVGPNAYVVTHLNTSKTTIHTQDIDRYISHRYYFPEQFSKEELHPKWTRHMNISHKE